MTINIRLARLPTIRAITTDTAEKSAQAFIRGVSPRTLLAQVDTTLPYLSSLASEHAELRFLSLLKSQKAIQAQCQHTEPILDHSSYFELCVAAHFATCGSFVPTDVDNQIRFRLWHPALAHPTLLKMTDFVEQARYWNVSTVTTRVLQIPSYSESLTGHRGEWLTIATGCYGALRRKIPGRAKEIFDLIRQEVDFETSCYRSLKNEQQGLALLKCTALLAHNLGDLQRTIEMWGLEKGDPLFDFAEEMLSPKYYNGTLIESGELYKAMMAPECHRFFALRSAKCLRQSPDFLIPIGPFFDDWGKMIARHPLLEPREIACVTECLVDGFTKLKNSIGYARALCGIETHFPGGPAALYRELPSRVEKLLKTGPLRQQCAIPKERFEAQWAKRALNYVREFVS